MTEEYKEKLKAGQVFQDFVQKQLLKHGIIVMLNTSEKYQNTIGESLSGVEIKLDRRFEETGNLYIEVAEKSDRYNPNYVESGIYRNDNTWLYCIGNYNQVFLIPKKQLQIIHKDYINGQYIGYRRQGIKIKKTPTSEGMVIPIDYALKYIVIKHVVFNEEMNET